MPVTRRFLRRIEILALKDKVTGSDPAQVPVSVTVQFFQPGATSKDVPKTVDPQDEFPTSLLVHDTGSLRVGDQLAIAPATAPKLVVNSIPSPTGLTVSALSTVTIQTGDRLVQLAQRPTRYSDPFGITGTGSSVTTDAATGRAFAYIPDKRFDYGYTIGGQGSRVFPDVEGGYLFSQPEWVNALDYPNIQDAVNAVPPEGGVVHIPASELPYDSTTTPAYTPPLRLPHNRAIHLLGDGPFVTVLKSTAANTDMIHMAGDFQTVEGLTLRGPNASGTGRGIRIWRDGDYSIPNQGETATHIIYRAAIRNCRIERTASWGIYVDTAVRGSLSAFSVWAMYDDVEIRNNVSGGCVYLVSPPLPPDPASGTTTTQYFKNCNFKNFTGYGIRAQRVGGLSLINCIVEKGDDSAPYVSHESCSTAQIIACWFEGTTSQPVIEGLETVANPNHYYVDISSYPSVVERPRSIVIEGCLFHRANPGNATRTRSKAIRVRSTTRGVVIVGPYVDLARAPADTEHVLLESDVQASVLGGTIRVSDDSAYPLRIDDSASNKSLLLNALHQLRIPRLFSSDEAERDKKALEGDIAYDLTTHALKICVGFSGGTPPTPLWKNILHD
ncbi:MAG: hypothetical protein ACREOU_15615 [Candidatus Eiseniibacteriota bacterium]